MIKNPIKYKLKFWIEKSSFFLVLFFRIFEDMNQEENQEG